MQPNDKSKQSDNKGKKKIKSDEALAEERFKQRLLEDGLLSEIKSISELPQDDWIPIKAKGKPLSQIIIEERR